MPIQVLNCGFVAFSITSLCSFGVLVRTDGVFLTSMSFLDETTNSSNFLGSMMIVIRANQDLFWTFANCASPVILDTLSITFYLS